MGEHVSDDDRKHVSCLCCSLLALRFW